MQVLGHGRLLACQPGLGRWRHAAARHACLLLALDRAPHVEEVAVNDLAVQSCNGCVDH
jgi:hypothetical protein